MFIDEECENLIVVSDGGELTRNVNQKKKSDVLQKSVDAQYLKKLVGESILQQPCCIL